MNSDAVRKIADAVLYEGYMLYPYRPSSIKNRQRWTFGGVYPEGYAANGERSAVRSEMLIEGGMGAPVEVLVRFLHLVARRDDRGEWQEGVEREVAVTIRVEEGQREQRFLFPASRIEQDGIVRRQDRLDGTVTLVVEPLIENCWKLRIGVRNGTPFNGSAETRRDDASLQALTAAHAIAHISAGAFVSLTDPPERFREAAAGCVNDGLWPVLAGDERTGEWMLASPIILSDYPEIAPESPGDLFDGAEIDEILTLRILTMTDAEKDEMRHADERTRLLLERTEALASEELMRLHGALRRPHAIGGRL